MKAIKKYNNIFSLLLGGLLVANFSFAQKNVKDTGFNKLTTIDEVIVTATRTQKSIGNIPVPIQVISKKFIQQTGSQKLIDILQQQTGLVLADNPLGQALQGYPNPFGSGIQLQGLDPAYTLILLDGEPLTGRNAGILNLGRVAVGNIQQIEIVKGPATSLYGSDALAGVINIITEKPKNTTAGIQLHHSTNNTWGFTASSFIKKNKTAFQLFANRYSSSGYDLDKTIYGKTADPYRNYSFAAKMFYDISSRTQLQTAARVFTQKQFNNYLVYTGAQPDAVDGTSNESDWSVNNQLLTTLSKKIKLATLLYITGYQNNAEVFLQDNKQLYDKSFLHQFLLKPEIQIEAGEKINQKLIAGAGYNYETIDANRYAESHNFNAFYFFTQKEWLFSNRLNVTAGARLDKHTLYNLQFNPKLAVAYKFFNKLTVNASIGTGFKAPDFRQQFLNFTNSLVGYTLLGASELSSGLQQLQQQGQIDPSINITPYLGSHTLLPEKSVGTNIGMRFTLSNKTQITSNLFRNDINNLIDRYNLPFTKVNNQSIYSYQNINKVFTRGFDVNINQQLNKKFTISGGYQYLEAKDKDIVKKIQASQVVKRDPVTFVSTYVSMKDYGGLFNRSKHAANLQLVYNNHKNNFSSSIRAIYRGRYGYSDINGNNILDDSREYVSGYTLLNASVTKTFKCGFELQTGSDNILNHRDKDKLPNLYGRTYFVNCNINLNHILSYNKKQ
ncbi:TonB-dependent receptor plug domain-containing protein [Ferruginibacter sp. SUN106]|uniref:TonB-dependent receptor plug domain-containing protein n=1 Tax=Ferruginibacter sp. SUN106 TaxID=2978348 RepID=UPI003D361F7F